MFTKPAMDMGINEGLQMVMPYPVRYPRHHIGCQHWSLFQSASLLHLVVFPPGLRRLPHDFRPVDGGEVTIGAQCFPAHGLQGEMQVLGPALAGGGQGHQMFSLSMFVNTEMCAESEYQFLDLAGFTFVEIRQILECIQWGLYTVLPKTLDIFSQKHYTLLVARG